MGGSVESMQEAVSLSRVGRNTMELQSIGVSAQQQTSVAEPEDIVGSCAGEGGVVYPTPLRSWTTRPGVVATPVEVSYR